MHIMAGRARAEGADPAVYDKVAVALAARREGWEADDAAYEAWSDSTAGTRDTAGKAQAELHRRGYEVPAWTPEDERSEPEADESERQADAEPKFEAEPGVSEPGASPEVAESAGPGIEPEPEPGMV
jgi:hypothetical protein